MIGTVFGKLEVVGLDRVGGGGAIFWICRCSCGKTKTLSQSSLQAGKHKSCGCGQGSYKRKALGESALSFLLRSYKYNAKERSLEFSLSFEKFKELTSSNCHYCNRPPFQEKKTLGGFGGYVYNGIDRIDNAVGYIDENVVPCCGVCNKAKGTMSYGKFRSWIFDAFNNMFGTKK